MFFDASSQGAAPKAGRLPQSIGIETRGGVFTPIIEHGTPLPMSWSESFTTADHNQPSIQIKVFQGRHGKTARNQRLGIFEVHGITPGPPGAAQVEVTFHVDAQGVLTVSAHDLQAGKELPVTVAG
jgi:molecular chaperone DnaK